MAITVRRAGPDRSSPLASSADIHRHIENGLSPLDAALVGAREIIGPVVAMTITLAAVYAPIGLMGGLMGALFREFAFTLPGR